MPRRGGTTRHVTHYADRLEDELDVRLLIRGLVAKRGLDWTHNFFMQLQSRRRGSLRRACGDLSPLAVSTLLQAMTRAEKWKDRIDASDLILILAGKKPTGKPSGGDEGNLPQWHLHFDVTRLSTEELRHLRELMTKARPALNGAVETNGHDAGA